MDLSEFNISVNSSSALNGEATQFSNPLSGHPSAPSEGLGNYIQNLPRPKHDNDLLEILDAVKELNNMAPVSMPEYNFNANEINGEWYNLPDGKPLLVREYDSDVIRDYYISQDNKNLISYIKEHDKITGRLRVKIDPIIREGCRKRTNITIFDTNVKYKYTILQLSEGGIVSSITEFSGEGKSFRTLFRNVLTLNPVRYMEGKEDKENGFEMFDCVFDSEGRLARIRRYNNKREVNINYTDTTKSISVKTKQ